MEAMALMRWNDMDHDAQHAGLTLLSTLGLDPTPTSAAAILEALGVWNPHEDIFARRLGADAEFPEAVQVRRLGLGLASEG